ncbi:MAG: hypothetical protein WC549_00585 [Actinomycetota bacterium]
MATVLDINQTSHDSTWHLRYAADTQVKIAQSFTPTYIAQCPRIDLSLYRSNSPTGNVWITIESDNSDSPSGSVLATSANVDVSSIGTSSAFIQFSFASAATLYNGTKYWTVLQGDYDFSTSAAILWDFNDASVIANYGNTVFNGSTWSATAVSDQSFKTYYDDTTVFTTSTSTTKSTSTSSTTTSSSTSTTRSTTTSKSTSTSLSTSTTKSTSTSSTTTSKSTSTTISTTRSTSTSTSSTTTTLATAPVVTARRETQMITGIYTGTGAVLRINGLGFKPTFIWIWTPNQYAVWSAIALPADTTMYFSNAAAGFSGGITAFNYDGFTLGTNATVNTNGQTHYYICFRDNSAKDFHIGSYTGDGTDDRAITGLGFQPDLVIIKANTSQAGCYRHSLRTGDTTYLFTGATATDHIQAILTDGFQIGTNDRVNTSGTVYYYIAFKTKPGFFQMGTYTGDGTNGRIAGVPFNAEMAWIQGRSSNEPVYVIDQAMDSEETERFGNNAIINNGFYANNGSTLNLGNNAAVNTNLTVYDYFVWKNFPQTDWYWKFFDYKVYDGQTYKTTWSSEVVSLPSFRTVINGGPGELIVKLKRNFDDFGEDVDVKLGNRVDAWVYDRDTPNGLLLFRGFISGYRPVLDGNTEYVEITVLSYIYELSNYILRDGSGNTKIVYNSQDPTDILKDILDKYRTDGGTLNYTATSIDSTGTTVSYTFQTNTIKEAIDKVIELAPYGWYWYVDPNGIVYFKTRPAVAEHIFYIGKEIAKMETWRRTEDLINEVYFTGFTTASGTGLYRHYSNTGSINSYNRHAYSYVDHRVSLTDTADTMANRLINDKKDPEIRTLITILDNNGEQQHKGYNIEAVQVGDMMKVGNIKQNTKTYSRWDQMQWDVDVWDQTLASAAADVIQIMAYQYSADSISIEASSRQPQISKRIEDINRNMVQNETVDNPTAPIEGS